MRPSLAERPRAADPDGTVYFTNAVNGTAVYYKIDGAGQAIVWPHDTSTVRGFFGDFGFDSIDRLWLSSSNIHPSELYLAVDGVPELVYLSRYTAFMGFRFIDPTQVVFGGQDSKLRQLDLCTGSASEVYTLQNGFDTQDVNTCPRSVDAGSR